MSFTSAVMPPLKRYFLSGVLVVVPLIITFVVLRFFFESVDGILRPLIDKLLGFSVPGLGFAATLILIFFVGIVTHNYIGGQLLRFWEKILNHVPMIRPVYSGAKQLLEATTSSSASSFKEVAVIEYPRLGVYSLCFVSQYIEFDVSGQPRKFASVFVPSTPTPVTGWSLLLPCEQVTLVDMSVESGIKFLVSGGVVSPHTLKRKPHQAEGAPRGGEV